ncbi:MAG: UTP--glucose-1-phosphate uridylyltransferase, partial [Kiritimatiellaeota bacterium]|nr:UTP--glucose-1-phosphate uridylyltransferase [Kiritimatiellota bacterium]
SMQFHDAQKLLAEHGQEHLLKFYDTLRADDREALLTQISKIDFDAVTQMRAQLAEHFSPNIKSQPARLCEDEITPAPVAEAPSAEAEAIGAAELAAGKVAALLVAGGQGTRLGYDGPKGCYGIGPSTNAPLFYFHARKILALSRRCEKPVPLYIMTSELNDAKTREFFAENDFFGLDEKDCRFFVQAMWPALDADGKIMLESPSRISLAADGHGGTLSALEKSGNLADMRKRGIETVFFFQVDNPLVDVCSPSFIGFHKQHGADISVKVCAKSDAREKVGMPVEIGGKTLIVEYTEFTDKQKEEKNPDGKLRFNYGSVNILAFSRQFLEREAAAGLPLHIAHKKIKTVDDENPAKENGYKFEKFIFDALADADVVKCLAFDRADEFAPVKNETGVDSAVTCKAALVAKWTRWLNSVGIYTALGTNVEIDPVFADSANALAKRVKNNEGNIWLFDK